MAQFGRYSSENLFEGATKTLVDLKTLKQRKGIADDRTAIMKDQAKTSAGDLTLAQGKHTADLQRIPVPERQFSESELAKFEGGMGAIDRELGTKLVNTTKPVLNIIKQLRDKGYRKIDTYRYLKQDWPKHVKPAQEGLKKMVAEAMANNDAEAVEKYGGMLDEVSSESFLNQMFSASARYEQDLQEGKKPEEAREQWSEPYTAGDARLQRNLETGKEFKVLGPRVQKSEVKTGEITKPTRTKVEQKLIEATGGLSRLSQIQSGFKPEYQEISTRFSAAWTAGKEKLGIKPTEKDRTLLGEFSEYKRDAINNLNLYIKEITGAQMSEAEAKRLTRGVPNPGKGVFDGDSPTQFKAKLGGTMKQLRVASSRYKFIKDNGLSISDVPLSQMPRIINNRAKQLEKQLQANNPNASINQIRQMVKETIAQEFGLVE